ncbi:hypothetical protein M432DRAFT_362614 [Thermoascus aurantiacus ATCC 26904]
MSTDPPQPAPFNLTELDRKVLSLTDEEFVPHDWENLKDIISRNDLGALVRRPSDLRRYIAWSNDVRAEYGSVTNYILQRRLGWSAEETKDGYSFPVHDPTPFADPRDYRILRNDWPYGFAPGITHLVVWLKTPLAVKPGGEGHITDESRARIDEFVRRTFVARLERERRPDDGTPRFPNPQDHVLWFKNWTGLQSVRALEHVHVLVRDVPEEIIVEWTGEEALTR